MLICENISEAWVTYVHVWLTLIFENHYFVLGAYKQA